MGGDQSLPSLRRHVADLTSKVRDAEIRSVGVFRTVAAAAAAAAANVVVTHATEHVGERERAPNDAPRSRALALRLRRLRYRLAVADRRLVVCSRSVVDCRLVGGEVQRTVERILEALRRVKPRANDFRSSDDDNLDLVRRLVLFIDSLHNDDDGDGDGDDDDDHNRRRRLDDKIKFGI